MKFAIINGDDYGYTAEKSEGILKAHKEGILTSTTVMINYISKTDINNILKHKKSLGIGLHLNITRGKPVSLPKEIPTLLNEKKEMFTPQTWMRKAWDDFGNLKNKAEIELEFNNQLRTFKEKLKIKPSHLDSHHGITSHKKIFPILLKIAKENDLPVRLPVWIKEDNNPLGHKFELEKPLAKKLKEQCKTTDNITVNFFCKEKDPVKEFKKSLRNIEEGTTEFVFHPSLLKLRNDKSIYGKIDLDMLTNHNIKKVIKEENIRLISYNQL